MSIAEKQQLICLLESIWQIDENVFLSTILSVFAALTQLVEYLTRNEKVAGSNPAGGSIFFLPFAPRRSFLVVF